MTLVPGELTVTPKDFFLFARGLKPGSAPQSGVLKVRNITTGPVDVRVKALPSDRELARVADMELSSGGRVMASTTIDALRRHRSGPMRIAVGKVGALRARVWIPRSVKSGYQARFADVTLDLRATVIKGSR